ncbi:MAG: hypothetical protein H7066_03355 [Cytophagaceae bacterium]|nr:hypothetical protein [Gemmatimonadaceae bacterium]
MLDMLAVWFELRFGQKPLLLFGVLGAMLAGIGVLAGLALVAIRIVGGFGYRPLIDLVMLCVIVGTVLFVGGLVGEMIAAQRAELRELRRRLDEAGR